MFIDGTKNDIENDNTVLEEQKYEPRLYEDPEVVGYHDKDFQNSVYNFALHGLSLENQSILDLGCGRGDFTTQIDSNFSNYDYVGVDMNPMFIDIAKEKYSKSNVNFVQDNWFGYLTDSKAADNKFDWIFSIMSYTVNYGTDNPTGDLYEMINDSMGISNNGMVLILTCNLEEPFLSFNGEFVGKLFDLYPKIAIDKLDFYNYYKIVLLN